METTLAVATALIALGGFGLGIRSYFRDKNRDEETRRVEVERNAFERKMAEQSAAIQQRLADIEEVRHRRELDAVATADAEREDAERRHRTADSNRGGFGHGSLAGTGSSTSTWWSAAQGCRH